MLELIQQGKIAELIISLIFDLILTAIAYLLVPTIICIVGYYSKRSYSIKTIKRIVLINGACVWLTLQIISISLGEIGVSAAVFIWSGLAYWLMRKILYKKSAEPKNDTEIEFEIVNKSKKARSFKIPFIIVSILLVLSFGLNLYQIAIKSDIQSNKELEQNREKLDFFDEYIVVIEDDNTNLYHKYECYRFKGEDFWAYNIDNAEDLGYEPCPNCCK